MRSLILLIFQPRRARKLLSEMKMLLIKAFLPAAMKCVYTIFYADGAIGKLVLLLIFAGMQNNSNSKKPLNCSHFEWG
jgi:hypothetical protein